MSLVAVLNSQPEVQALVERALAPDRNRSFVLAAAKSNEEAFEILSFDLPEIVLWNATDPNLDPAPLLESLQSDSWMHNFGIVAVFDPKVTSEVKVNEKLRAINVLTVLPLGALGDQLLKHLRILDANRQILVHLQLGPKEGARATGSFNIDNDPTIVPVYAGLAAQSLVQRGYLPAKAKRELQIALSELIQNGIEHGHLKIDGAEKAEFLAQGGSMTELIRAKVDMDPLLAEKKVTLEWEIQPTGTRFFIRDQGSGFDVEAYRERMRSHQLDELSGRGIRLARSLGGKVSYNRKGNVACLQLSHDAAVERKTPRGFEAEEVLVAKKGDVVFQQGEISDHIFYIMSGQFGVYHDEVPVGWLTPADVFMGEMSFLMNNVRTASVVCETPGRLVKINRRSFVRTLRLYPQYGLFLAKLMARKLSNGNEERSQRVMESREAEALGEGVW
jgi:anti-sigma regulatory factor (Ser/Thr protein kinase)